MSTSFFHDILGSIEERGRHLIDHAALRLKSGGDARPTPAKSPETLEAVCRALLSSRGEASGVALARQVLDLYGGLAHRADRLFPLLARDFGPDRPAPRAWASYDQTRARRQLHELLRAVEPPRQELFRRLNLAPGGTRAMVQMREDLVEHGGKEPELTAWTMISSTPVLLVQPRLPDAAAH